MYLTKQVKLYLDIVEVKYIDWCEADSKCLRVKTVITKEYSVSNFPKHMRINEEAKNGDRRAEYIKSVG